jgi:hypothetical protein
MFSHFQKLLNVQLLVADLFAEIVALFEKRRMGEFVGPFYLLDLFQSFGADLAGYKLNGQLVVSLVMEAIVHGFSSGDVLDSGQTLFFVALGVHSKGSEVQFF